MVWKLQCERNLPNGTSRYKPTQLLHLISTVQDFGLASIWDVAHEPAQKGWDGYQSWRQVVGQVASFMPSFPLTHISYTHGCSMFPHSHMKNGGAYVPPQNVRQVVDFKFTPFCRQTQAMFVVVYSNPTSNISKNIHKTVECPLLYHLARGRSWSYVLFYEPSCGSRGPCAEGWWRQDP